MIKSINPEHTLYAIYLVLQETQRIAVGKLGTYPFEKGIYIYVGSAKKNMKQRIERHIRKEKNYHWHFDYLRSYGTITKIITYDDSLRECDLAEKIRKETKGSLPVKGFGSSDCKCISHLIFLENE